MGPRFGSSSSAESLGCDAHSSLPGNERHAQDGSIARAQAATGFEGCANSALIPRRATQNAIELPAIPPVSPTRRTEGLHGASRAQGAGDTFRSASSPKR